MESPKLPDPTTIVDLFKHPDDALQSLAERASLGGTEASVTVYLPWGVASGRTISAQRFYRDTEAALTGGAGDGNRDGTAAFAKSFFGSRADDAQEHADDLNNGSGEDCVKMSVHQGYLLQTYLHLADVICYAGGTRVNTANLRIRLADVSSWTFGQLEHLI